MAVQGTWNIGGFNLPDLGLTERLFGSSNKTFYNPAVPQSKGLSSSGFTSGFSSNPTQQTSSGGGSWNSTPTQSTQQKSTGGITTNEQAIAAGFTGLQDMQNQQSSGSSVSDLDAQRRAEIEGGYGEYFAQLDSMLNTDLPAQQSAQLGIAQSQGTQAETTLGAQKDTGMADLATYGRQVDTNQGKTLQDLSQNIRDMFKSGQIMIGAKGAGDSSATNQYSYALSKEGNKSRGNVLAQTAELHNQIKDKEFKLKTTFDSELNNIKEQVNQKTMEIANWFSQAQMQLKQAKAQGALQKGQDLAALSTQLLNQAMQQMMMTQQEAANKRSMLDQWAMNNSTTIQGLKANLAAIPQNTSTAVYNPGIAQVTGQPSTTQASAVPYGQGTSTSSDWLKKLYGTA